MRKASLLLAIILCTFLGSCSDKDDQSLNQENMLGSWIVTSNTAFEILPDGLKTALSTRYKNSTWTIHPDAIIIRKETDTEKYQYTLSGNCLTLISPNNQISDYIYTITEFNKNSMTLFHKDKTYVYVSDPTTGESILVESHDTEETITLKK